MNGDATEATRFSLSGVGLVYRQVFNTVFLAVAVAGSALVLAGLAGAAIAAARRRAHAKVE